jgi:RNA polymerase sigma-70 factor (ECF subfamily)
LTEFIVSYDLIIKPIEKQLMNTTYRITRNDDFAQRAFQNTLIKIWKQWQKVKKHPNPRLLCLRICINCCYDILRKKRKAVSVDSLDSIKLKSINEPMYNYESEERIKIILSEISKLSKNQRLTFHLNILENVPYSDIAKILNCSEATVRKHKQRAREKLAQKIKYIL